MVMWVKGGYFACVFVYLFIAKDLTGYIPLGKLDSDRVFVCARMI